MILDLTPRRGIFPKIAAEQLPPGAGITAQNCKVSSGVLVPLKATAAASAVIKASTKTLWRFAIGDSDWLSWTYDTDIAKCPVANDAFGRIYFTTPAGAVEAGKVQMLNYYTDTAGTKNTAFLGSQAPTGSYHLGMPAPTVAPTFGTPTGGDASNPEEVEYVYTYVSTFGEESPPSPTSALLTRNIGATVPVNWTQPGGDYTGRATVAYVNIYRTNVGSTTTEFQYVTQRPVADGTWDDTVANDDLDEVLATTYWDPPVVGMMGLKNLPNGAIVGFKDNAVYFSEPFQPHAWPIPYRVPVPFPLVGVEVVGMTVIALTTGPSYLLTGNVPGAITPEKMEVSFSCISKRSIVDVGDAVVYASPVGLVAVTPSGATVVTKEQFRKEDWDVYSPSTISAWQFAGSYLGFYDDGASNKGGVVYSAGEVTTLANTFEADAGWYDQADGELYLVINDAVVQYDVGPTTLSATHRSRVVELPSLTNFAVVQINADAYPLTFRLYDYTSGTAVLKDNRTISSVEPVRLTDGYLYRKIAVELITTKRVTRVLMAHSIGELAQV